MILVHTAKECSQGYKVLLRSSCLRLPKAVSEVGGVDDTVYEMHRANYRDKTFANVALRTPSLPFSGSDMTL